MAEEHSAGEPAAFQPASAAVGCNWFQERHLAVATMVASGVAAHRSCYFRSTRASQPGRYRVQGAAVKLPAGEVDNSGIGLQVLCPEA